MHTWGEFGSPEPLDEVDEAADSELESGSKSAPVYRGNHEQVGDVVKGVVNAAAKNGPAPRRSTSA